MRKPNFFILGAPKCGTTSLAAWLSGHSNIFIPDMKEPNFFNTDRQFIYRLSSKEYASLFRGAGPEHSVVGEASTGYLSSRIALPAILKYADPSRFVICIRNPVDMVVSWHGQLLRMGVENMGNFEDAWKLQEERDKGGKIPLLCKDAVVLQYGFICCLGQQLKNVLKQVPRERVCVVVLDDMKQDPLREYRRVLNFLGVKDDGRRSFPVHNPAVRIPARLAVVINLATLLKRRMRIRRRFGMIRWLEKRVQVKDPDNTPTDDTLSILRDYFRGEIELLSTLLDRDFSPWLCGESVASESRTHRSVGKAVDRGNDP